MKSEIQAVRGMRDVSPDESRLWRQAENAACECFRLFGYREIRPPIVERAELFSRQLGEHSDLVEKEMYAFSDLGGEPLALRPEATVGIARALIENGLARSQARVFCIGPMFRRERPQRGRYRQFHQLDAEAVGFASPAIDAELLIMCQRLWENLGVDNLLSLEINNLGDAQERAIHRQKLSAYFEKYRDDLDDSARRRIADNPLRILDSKDPKTAEIAQNAPALKNELGKDSRRFVDSVCEKLMAAGVAFRENPRLVRGLDYYNLTVFEWTIKGDDARQNAVCGGGRYDGLIAQLGGTPTPGCGFAAGLERLLTLMQESKSTAFPNDNSPQVYVAIADYVAAAEKESDPAVGQYADSIAEELRQAEIRTMRHLGGGNLSKQLKKADSCGAEFAAIIGEDEVKENKITIKPLRGGEQKTVAREDLIAAVISAVKGN